MSTEEVLRNRIRKKPKVGVRISKNSSRIVTDEGFSGNEEKSGYERRKFYERGDRENGYKGKLKKNVNFGGIESGEERSCEHFYERVTAGYIPYKKVKV
jgi:hypothetical protein